MVRTVNWDLRYFRVEVGLHQGTVLSPFLFVTMMDVLSGSVGDRELWELLFADELVMMAGSEEELQGRVLEWRESLGKQG